MKKTLFLSAILGAAFCCTAFGAQQLTTDSSVVGGTTYSGGVYTFSATGTISTSTHTADVDSASGAIHAGDTAAWGFFASNQGVEYGHTIHLTQGGTYTSNFSPFTFGGLIVDSGLTDVTLGRDATATEIIGNGAVNMTIGSNTTILGNSTKDSLKGVTIKTGGTWTIADGKTLTLSASTQGVSFAGDANVTLSGTGTLNFVVNATAQEMTGNGYATTTYTIGDHLTQGGAQLKLNGAAATFSEGVLTATGTTYLVNVSETYTSTDAFAGATAVNVKSGATMTMSDTTGTIDTKVVVDQGGTFKTQGTGTLTATTLQSSRGDIELGADTHITGGGNGQGSTNNKLGLSLQGVDGTLSIVAGTTTVDGATYMGAGNTAANNTVNVGMGDTDAKLVTERLELGDSNGGTSTLNIGEHGTLVVKSSTDASGGGNAYKNTGLMLSEWNNATTANIAGKLFAKDVQLRSGDTKVVLNIDGGTLAVKGISQNTGKSTANEITVSNNGKLILGSGGIASTGTAWTIALNSGEVGMTDNTTLAKDMVLGGAVNFNTSKYTWDANKELVETNDGTNGGTMTVSGALSGTGSVVKNGEGTLNLTGANTYSGGTTVNAGKLSVHSLGSGDVTLNNGSTLEIGGEQIVSGMGTVTVNDASTIILGYGSAIGTSTAAATIVMNDGATLIQQNGNGTVNHDSYADITIDGMATICGSYYGNYSNLHGTISGEAGSTLVLDKYDNNVNKWTLDSALSGGMALQVNDNDVTLTGDSSFTGGTIITGGSVTADSNTALGTGAVELNDGALVVNAEVTVGGLTQNGGSIAINEGKSLTINTTESVAVSDLTLNAGSTITLGDHTPDLIVSNATIAGNTTIEADVVLAEGGTMTFENGVVTLGCTVEFGEGTTIALGTAYYDELAANGKVLLFTGVDAVNGLINGLENVVVTGDFVPGKLIAEQQTDGSFNIYATPEPATATLSLLALAGLMARRRRH